MAHGTKRTIFDLNNSDTSDQPQRKKTINYIEISEKDYLDISDELKHGTYRIKCEDHTFASHRWENGKREGTHDVKSESELKICNYIQGIKWGKVTTFSSGMLKRISFYENNKLEGPYVEFHDDGSRTEGNYNNGLMEGPYKVFDRENKLQQFSLCKRGLLDGIQIKYQNGRVFSETSYLQGEKDGEENYYSKTGERNRSITWKKGLRHGIEKIFTLDGKFRTHEINWHLDKKNGIEEIFTDKGVPHLIVTWSMGVIHGRLVDYMRHNEFLVYYPLTKRRLIKTYLYNSGMKEGRQFFGEEVAYYLNDEELSQVEYEKRLREIKVRLFCLSNLLIKDLIQLIFDYLFWFDPNLNLAI